MDSKRIGECNRNRLALVSSQFTDHGHLARIAIGWPEDTGAQSGEVILLAHQEGEIDWPPILEIVADELIGLAAKIRAERERN